MTEVREDKEKSASQNVQHEGSHKENNGNEVPLDKSDPESRTCPICGRIFKNERARRTHEHHCKKKKDKGMEHGRYGAHNVEGSGEFGRLRQELSSEMEAIKTERLKLIDERNSFLAEMRMERERLNKDIGRVEGLQPSTTQEKQSPQEESKLDDEISKMEIELAGIDPEVEDLTQDTQEADLADLTIELENLESELTTKVDFGALTKMAEDFNSSVKGVEDEILKLNSKIQSMNKEMEESGSKYGTYQHIIKEMRKLDEKNTEILEEIGFGESMNVSKIPPKILESVYDSTIDDIVSEIHRNHGSHDAEVIVNRTLEDIRTRTSGSELFFFDGRILRTRNLAKVISSKLISARQVQTTYDELLSKLLEYIPGYKAKNFRAMIKLKSQEYAVDKTTSLLDRFNLIKEDINHLKNMVGSVSNRQNTIELEINNLIKSMVGTEDKERINTQIAEFKGLLSELGEALQKQREESEAHFVAISNRFEDISNQIEQSKQKPLEAEEEPKIPTKQGVVELVDEDEEEVVTEVELSEDENRIYLSIPKNGFTLYKIKKELGKDMDEETIEKCLESLLEKGVMSTEKRGRHTIYMKTEKTEVKNSA
jgi:chromosome segregation ATPase